MQSDRFDAAYYQRFYEDGKTAVVTPGIQRNEVAFVLAFCRHIDLEVKRFADAGAGTGWWAREFAAQYPECDQIETFDASKTACDLYGHRRLPLQRLAGKAADLVICRDVLRYMNDADAEEGIRRLEKKCRGILYLHVVTREDDFDKKASDAEGWFRPVAWYRRRLKAAGFRDCGMGIFLSGRADVLDPWALEAR
ncbi:MAG: class I SAM-dependent methyltransferase [Gemmatimonadota bacterium]|nr:class I SAM-dependent methyltransferase [Gemmatimonadota bacterium]